jgi:hypothetical protein
MVYVKTDHRYLCEYGPGYFTFFEEKGCKKIIMKLPDHAVCVLQLTPPDPKNWSWDGDEKHPTITPAIIHWGYNEGKKFEAWQGCINKGKMESL